MKPDKQKIKEAIEASGFTMCAKSAIRRFAEAIIGEPLDDKPKEPEQPVISTGQVWEDPCGSRRLVVRHNMGYLLICATTDYPLMVVESLFKGSDGDEYLRRAKFRYVGMFHDVYKFTAP